MKEALHLSETLVLIQYDTAVFNCYDLTEVQIESYALAVLLQYDTTHKYT
jgi:hypothetical protein